MGGRQAVRPRTLDPVSKVRILPAQPVSKPIRLVEIRCDMSFRAPFVQRDGAHRFCVIRWARFARLEDLTRAGNRAVAVHKESSKQRESEDGTAQCRTQDIRG